MGEQFIYDVIIVGAGNAALCAAISAKEQGLHVLVVERGEENKRGGNSFFTDGAIRCAYDNIEKLQGIIPELTDDRLKEIAMPTYKIEDFYTDLMRVTEEESDKTLAQMLVTQSFDTIQWMHQHGVKFELNENQAFEQDGKLTFWGGLPIKTHKKGIGLIEALFNRVEELGGNVIYESRVINLLQENGRIQGIEIEKPDSTRVKINSRSVILACGGFEANKDMRVKFLGEEWEHAVVRGTEYNTGDGITMALAAGAQPYGQWDGCHAHTTDYNAPRYGDFAKPGDIYKKSSYPLGLIINTNGERFVDEGADFRNYTYAKYGKETLKQDKQKAYQIFDSQVRHLLRKEYNLEEASFHKADTLEELACEMGVDKQTFFETIETYNQSVQEGDYNPSIKDGKKTIGVSPSKSNWALAFNNGPFYAYPVTCGITFTFGAVHVNDKSEVLDENKQPIPGLLAAGEMVGGLFYHNYPGGSGLMSGAVFGRQAGRSAAEYLNKQKDCKITDQ